MVKNVAREPNYRDIDLDFLPHPTTKDVVKKTGIDAIKRSVRNLVLTNFYDRPFQSYIGSNAQKLLFENINPLTQNFIKDAIEEVITNFEPRVRLVDNSVNVRVSPDNNGYDVTISFIEVSREEPATISFFLERIR